MLDDSPVARVTRIPWNLVQAASNRLERHGSNATLISVTWDKRTHQMRVPFDLHLVEALITREQHRGPLRAGKVLREPDDHVPVTQHKGEMLRIASRDLTTAI